MEDLVKQAKIKFDHYIDPLQLGAQFLKVKELKDYPRMIIEIDENIWQTFFLDEAKKMEHNILE